MIEVPSLDNRTDAAATVVPALTRDGFSVLVVAKRRFSIGPDGAVRAERGARIRATDEPWDDAGPSSVRYPHDLAPSKPHGDVVVVGDAIAPRARPVQVLEVHVQVGRASRVLRVYGPRAWYDRGDAIVPTDPVAFTRVALRWENAFGGRDLGDPQNIVEEPRNPLGVGVARDPASLIGRHVPQIEDPDRPIVDHRTRPAPAGVGAIGPDFEPRRSYAGTRDEAWRRDRMPLPPIDFDDRYHRCAPPPLSSHPIAGGESVRLMGLHASGPLAFTLPKLSIIAEHRGGETALKLDTILLEPNELRMELTSRAVIAWPAPSARRASIRLRERP